MSSHLLLVEDNPGDALLLQSMLDDRYPGQYATVTAATLAEAQAAILQQSFDAVLLDLSLPDSQGLETISRLAADAQDLPIVVLTGVDDEEIALEAVRRGAEDYLLKGHSDGPAIARSICYAIDRKWAEKTLRAQRQELEAKNKQLQEIQRRLEAYRDRYVDLYDRAPLGLATLDEDAYVQEINLAGVQLLHADRDALTGYPFIAYVAKDDVPVFSEHVRQCVRERREVTSEVRLTAEGGRLIFVQLRSIPVESVEEEVTYCRTAIADITQRKEMEETIRQSRAFLQTVLDAIPDAMLVVDRDYHIVLTNRAARELAGGIDPAAQCLACYEVLHGRKTPCEGEGDSCPLRSVIATRAPATVVHTHQDAHGKAIRIEVTVSPVFDAAGVVTHIVEVCREIA